MDEEFRKNMRKRKWYKRQSKASDKTGVWVMNENREELEDLLDGISVYHVGTCPEQTAWRGVLCGGYLREPVGGKEYYTSVLIRYSMAFQDGWRD
mgnify:CR=1 FL=1